MMSLLIANSESLRPQLFDVLLKAFTVFFILVFYLLSFWFLLFSPQADLGTEFFPLEFLFYDSSIGSLAMVDIHEKSACFVFMVLFLV